MNTRILIPSGVLGLGFDQQALARGLANSPDAICIDGGSTDSGPFYLGTGTSKYSETSTRSEWRDLMIARDKAEIPLIIGSCGTCGTDSAVDWMYELTISIAQELKQNLRIARLYSNQSSEELIQASRDNRLHQLSPAIGLSDEDIATCSNIVALAGAEQINQALDSGADIILAGRTTDTAVIAAIPLRNGVDAGAAWHGSKIGECGALCSTDPTSGVIQIDFGDDGFSVFPLAENARCTTHSVSAHMLYENADPIHLLEPGGCLDVSQAQYVATDEHTVHVNGSRWHTAETYTVKLEGARLAGYQTSSLVILRQPEYVARAQEWITALGQFLEQQITQRMNIAPNQYTLECRLIGVNATLGALEILPSNPSEVGVLMLVTAQTQATATDIARLCNPFLLHFPLSSTESLPTFSFPYSPVESERGALYEFALNHVLELKDPMENFRLTVSEVSYA